MSRDHVHVLLDGELVDDATLTWINDGTILLSSTPTVGTAVKVYRETPKDNPWVVFPETTQAFDARDFNRLALATLYISQENYDLGRISADQLSDSIDYINEALGTISDAVTSTGNSASAAAASAAEASGYAAAGALAQAWAEAAGEIPGNPGHYSAKHWAEQAAAIVVGEGLAASAVDYTPGAGMSSTNVQDAIDELNTAKAPASGGFVTLSDETSTFANSRALTNSTQVTKNTGTSGQVKLELVLADATEAKAGTDNVKVMTSARVADAVAAYVRKMLCGTMFRVPATAAPPGAVILDGTEYLRADKPDLYAFAVASGNIVAEADWSANPAAFSSGDGSTTFRVPNRRGYFERNYVAGGSLDSGRDIGKAQASSNLSHGHTGSGSVNLDLVVGASGLKAEEGGTGTGANSGTNTKPVSVSISTSGGSEARPNNMASLLCMWDGTVPT
jgi:hypothetical protein